MSSNQPSGALVPHAALEQQADVVLVSMPFGLLFNPSLALGLLKGSLKPLHVSTKVLYFTLRFAEQVGTSFYQRIANGEPNNVDLVGEWIFSEALFEGQELDKAGYIEDVLHRRSSAYDDFFRESKIADEFIHEILLARSKVARFLDDCVEEVMRYHPKIVGFTSVFQQQVASLALARRLKARAPEIFVVLGGANCEGAMGREVARQFPFVDAVVSGEGDLVFPELVQRVLEGRSCSTLRGVFTQRNASLATANSHIVNAQSVHDMDALPFPDFDDFFEQFEMTTLDNPQRLGLTFETSRGCWWGEKNHCTFCGLNGSTMAFRSKSAQRALDELLYLTRNHPGCYISVVDNIMDMKYFKDFVPMLSSYELGLELFYEVKANLRKEQIHLLHDAGIREIQPGIESLSNRVLEMMRKGIKGLQNIQLLKWCKELGVTPLWNVLWGFPGEPPEEYVQMRELIPLLTHLTPPKGMTSIRLDRFSPNFDAAEQYGFTDITPYPAYSYIYPFPMESVANLAYFFTYHYREPQDSLSYVQPLVEEIYNWRSTHQKSKLIFIDEGSHLLIWDLRPIAKELLIILDGIERILYLACDGIRTTRQLQQLIEEHCIEEESSQKVETILQPLVEQGLMLRDGNSYLSLALPQPTKSASNSTEGGFLVIENIK